MSSGTSPAAGPAGGAARSEPSELLEVATRVAGWARDGEQVEVFVARGRDTEVKVFEGEVESLSSAESAGVGVRVIADHREGFAYAGSLDDDVVAETLAETRDNAGFGSPDDHLGLALPDGVAPAPLDLWRDELAAFPASEKVALALELERMVRAGDPRIRQVESAEWSDGAVESAVATSTGIAATSRRTSCFVFASAIAGEGADTQTGSGYSIGRGPAEIDLAKATGDAVERATRLLGARKPRSARVTVVFEPRVTATLLSVIAGTLSGEAVLKGRSMFADRVDEAVSVGALTLVDDPTDPAAYSASQFDAEGLACRRNVLVDQGVLRRFLYHTYSARRAGTTSTASAVRASFKSAPGVGARAVSIVPGTASPEEVLKAAGDGLLVQSVSGVHSGVNPVSGDFSVGAEGLLISGGAPAAPVREITIASTLQRMLHGVVAIGSDQEWLPGRAAGLTLAIADVTMSGN
jgi:PmbA protein